MTDITLKKSPVLLLVLDGWGLCADSPGNAIKLAQPQAYEQLLAKHSWIEIEASGEPVGLPDGQMGNSEVGHLNLGAGRVIYQELTRINKDIREGHFFTNPALLDAMAHAKKNNSTLHLMGLCSDGGVHSSLEHAVALIEMAKDEGIEKLRFHAFLDGRDVAPKSAEAPLRVIEETLLDLGFPQIATICGRYYAMDRDKRWDRVQLAYDNMTIASGSRHLFSIDGLQWAYRQEELDEFVKPQVTDVTYEGMQDGDAVIFYNFRPDRARQIVRSFVDSGFNGFPRQKFLQNLHFTTMTPYEAALPLPVAYAKTPLTHLLGDVISEAGLKQFRTAETEKFAHVTYFFNGGVEQVLAGETRFLVDSPKIATYDLQPEMSLPAVAEALVDAIRSKNYQLLVANFANPDMVGHTGKLNPAIQAVSVIDTAIKQVSDAILAVDGVMLLTADHGNVECMIADDGGEHTAHTTDPVPLVLVSNDADLILKQVKDGALANVAPTILDIMGLPIPPEMTAPSLLAKSVTCNLTGLLVP